MSELKGYSFESPLLVTDRELICLPAEAGQSGEKWLAALKERTGVLAIVLPLEIKASDHHARQDLLGLELLSWLRWSADEPFRYVPVLVVAWQSLDAVLRRTLNLLLVTRGTTFVRLPEAVEVLPRFVDGVRRQNDPSWPRARIEDLERIAGSSRAERISYHDLANEYYGAFRLWEGYKHALKAAGRSQELQRVDSVSFSFMKDMQERLRRPGVREYLASRRQQASPIYYPVAAKSDDLIRSHAEHGLPEDIRILMVDDEFEKGLAEVLLQMLFKASEFSFQLDGEWVYSLDQRARLVCVNSIRKAACWLKHWGEVDVFKDLGLQDSAGREWIGRWTRQFGRDVGRMESDQLAEMSKQILGYGHEAQIVDRPLRGLKSTTVLLLDLHLEKSQETALYEPRQLASVRLWQAVKDESDELPILIYTASRQAMNYSAMMEAAGPADGWLTKEGPDITLDGEHSSRAALYLLDRLHMFSSLRDWYRTEINWNPSWRQTYASAYQSSHWKECESHIAAESTRIYQALLTNPQSFFQRHFTLRENVERQFTPKHFSLETTLVSRRVALAALLETARTRPNGSPCWDVDAFRNRLNCSSAQANPQYPHKVFSFQHVLWFKRYTPEAILGSLLKEEYEWLRKTFPESNYPWIYKCINRASDPELS